MAWRLSAGSDEARADADVLVVCGDPAASWPGGTGRAGATGRGSSIGMGRAGARFEHAVTGHPIREVPVRAPR